MFKKSKLFCLVATLFMGIIPFVTAGTNVYASEISNSEVRKIESKYSPSVTVESENEISATFIVSEDELAQIENIYTRNNMLRANNTSYGSFKKSSAIGIAGILAGIAGFGGTAAALGIAGILASESGTDTIYYSYTQTSWHEGGVFKVRGTFKFYRNASRTSYITSLTLNKSYQND